MSSNLRGAIEFDIVVCESRPDENGAQFFIAAA